VTDRGARRRGRHAFPIGSADCRPIPGDSDAFRKDLGDPGTARKLLSIPTMRRVTRATGAAALACALITGASFYAPGGLVAAEPSRAEVEAPPAGRLDAREGVSGTASGWLRMPGPTRARYTPEIREIAERYGMDPVLVEAVIRVESAFNPLAVSRKGARGLMQLMPSTASALGVQDSFDPRQNIDGGVRHLRALIERYNGDLPLALAAYNAGEGAVETHGGIPPFPETQQYVRKVLHQARPAREVPKATAARPAGAASSATASAGSVRPPTAGPVEATADPAAAAARRPTSPSAGVAEPLRSAAASARSDDERDDADTAPSRRLAVGPRERLPALPLIEEARRAARPGVAVAALSLARALEAAGEGAEAREGIDRVLARLRQQSRLSADARDRGSAGAPAR
jgi:hypothetical protein